MSTLLAITYENTEKGKAAFDEVQKMMKMQLISLEDMALAYKNEKGKVKVKQTLEKANTGSSASWGGFWGLLIGLLFWSPLLWGLIGALIGGLVGKTTDLGIDNKWIKEVGESLDPGGSALFLLVIEATEDKAVDGLSKYGGEVYQTSLSKDDEEKLKTALARDEVKAAAEDNLALE